MLLNQKNTQNSILLLKKDTPKLYTDCKFERITMYFNVSSFSSICCLQRVIIAPLKCSKLPVFTKSSFFLFVRQIFGSVYSGLGNTHFDKVSEGPASGSKK